MPTRQAFKQAQLDLLYAHERNGSLCAPFVSVLPVAGASLSVLAGSLGQSTVCASDDIAARLDELQFDLGEGPCWDALSTRLPVLSPDFPASGRHTWPLFANALHEDALGSGVRAVYAFPLALGSLDIGAVDLYSSSNAPLDEDEVSDATKLASLAAWQLLRRILADQPTGDLEPQGTDNRREVHQATGMVLAQLGISAADAALLLRAHAFSSGRTVAEIANDIIERRLDFALDGTL
ncbi:GAF domain-containing protein [Conyzicola nivalis]|uniref:GAF domain-containing protein n=1 Tax=Conyzicola nivalis TaxID=1477021 RepID=A0A916SDG6_9MICO|nr:GAF domain-containing protein [Conyzicola nivalis]GGA94769.1 GAF domain-containing protein [Conyzicola nivalis]